MVKTEYKFKDLAKLKINTMSMEVPREEKFLHSRIHCLHEKGRRHKQCRQDLEHSENEYV